MTDNEEVRVEINEAFVVKYARTGVIIRYKGGLWVDGKGYLRTRDGCFPRSQWAKTLDEAKDLYRKASEKSIRSMQKQIDAMSKRIDHPTIEDRIGEENA